MDIHIINPTVIYLLLVIGMYGLFFEIANPGFLIPGIIGTIALFIALYGLALLPFSYLGLALIFLGFACIIAELFLMSFGIFAIAGVITFTLGSFILFNPQTSGIHIASSIIITVSIITLLFIFIIIRLAVKARTKPIVTGDENIIGSVGPVIKSDNHYLQIRLHGELWQIKADEPLAENQTVKVIARDGLILMVKPYQ